MNKTLEGIILSSREYREYDVILTVLCKELGVQSLVARGIRKLSSKNAGACQLFTYARFYIDYHEQKRMHGLRTADVIDSYRIIREDLIKQAVASLLCECMEKAELEQEEAFDFLKEAMDDLKESDQPYALLALFFACMNHKLGIEPYVDGCVSCGRTHGIAGISLAQGGFVCQSCLTRGKDQGYGKEDLKCFRILCHANLSQFPQVVQYQNWTYEHFMMVYRFFEEYSGIRLKSIRFLTCLQSL